MTDRWRVIVVRAKGAEVLFVKRNTSLGLPEVQIPRKQRIAWHLNEQLRQVWQLPVVSTTPLPYASNQSETPVRYHVAEILDPALGLRSNLLWMQPSVALQESTVDPADATALEAFALSESPAAPKQGPFASLGWFHEVSLWLRSAAAALALEWDGAFEQFNATDSFSLIRFATKPRALWFKAVGNRFASEFHVSRLLARRIPGYVPRVVATREDWRAWLSEECLGSTLDAASDIRLWQIAVAALAQLQIESTRLAPDLRKAQAHPLNRILSGVAVDRFRAIASDLLSVDAKSSRQAMTENDLADIDCALRHCVAAVSTSGIPDALGHLDLNSGNAVVAKDHCAYLDWAEASVGFPFLTLEYLLQSFRRTFGGVSLQERDLVETYLSAWEDLAPRHAVQDAWTCTPALAVFAYFLRCIDRCDGEILGVPGRAEYLSFLLLKLKREAAISKATSEGIPR